MDNLNRIVSKNIKETRKEKNISLDELARLSGVSKSMLAQIERGEGNPTLSTLWKIANGMSVPFTALVTREQTTYETVSICSLEPITEQNGAIRNYSIFPDNEDRHFSIYYIEVAPGAAWQAEAHLRGTVEFVTVFAGELEVGTQESSFRLKAGDSLRFKADVPHAYRSVSDDVTVFHNILYNR